MPGLAATTAGRIAALAVALALSGLPELAEPPREAGHRCHCPVKNGRHDCDCPLCHAEAARLGKSAASDPSLPACHRALAARKAAEVEVSSRRRAVAAPCLVSTCGTSEGRLRPPPAAERFTVPPSWQLTVREAVAEVPAARGLALVVPREPETPPPRSV